MDEAFLNEDLNGHLDWEAVNIAGEVSLIPSSSENEGDILAVQIDIHSRLKTLKEILSKKIGVAITHYELWLQDLMQVCHI